MNFVHRWDKYETKRGRQPGFDMIVLLIPVLFKFLATPQAFESAGIQIGADH